MRKNWRRKWQFLYVARLFSSPAGLFFSNIQSHTIQTYQKASKNFNTRQLLSYFLMNPLLIIWIIELLILDFFWQLKLKWIQISRIHLLNTNLNGNHCYQAYFTVIPFDLKENQKMECIFVLRYAFFCNLITNDHVYKNLEAGTMFGSIVLSINLK